MSDASALGDLIDEVRKLPRQFFEPLPAAVIRYWLEGKYAGGLAPSVAYEELGWRLMIRGFYRYKVEVKTGNSNKVGQRGYCMFDLREGDFECKGIRVLCSSDHWPVFKGWDQPFLWKSDASAIRSSPDEKHARLTCATRMLATKAWSGVSNLPTAFESIWTDVFPGTTKKIAPDQNVDIEKKEEAIAIPYLASRFDDDWGRIKGAMQASAPPSEAPVGEFSGFMVSVRVAPPGAPVVLIGDYNALRGVSGLLTLTRIDDFVF